mmetsp:Transcript_28676/g.32794  ORF Transcript_28676/g.32794 Transcript_28676/m.32794 type:complete len:411 (+) Transcript_28676:344-1576(+)
MATLEEAKLSDDEWEIVTRRCFIGRWGMRSSVSDRYIFVAGGTTGSDPITNNAIYSNSCNVYDTQSNKWIALPDAGLLFAFTTFVNGDYVYHIIGQHKKLYRLNIISLPETDWEEMAEMISARFDANIVPSCVEENYCFYISGGYHGQELQCVERYHPTEDRWEKLPDLPEGRHKHASAVVKNKLYVFGGSGKGWDDDCVSSSRMYNMELMTWSIIPDLPMALSCHSATTVGKWIVVTGGCIRECFSGDKICQSIFLFNTETLKWYDSVTQLPYALSEHGSCILQNGTNGPRIALIGGRKGKGSYSDVIIAIDFVRLLLKPNKVKQLSLIKACRVGLSWMEGVKDIVGNQPESVTHRDSKTGLLPFMLAPDVGSCYELLHCTLGSVASLQGWNEGEREQKAPAKKKAKTA